MTLTKKAYQSFKLAMLSLLLMLIFSAYPLTVHADSAAGAIIDSLGKGSATTSTHIEKGVTYARTGYLCYLLTKDGNSIPGMTAKVFLSSGTELYDGTVCIAKSRKGNYSATSYVGTAPWGCTPFNNSDDYGNVSTNEPIIKAWLAAVASNGNTNAANFVYQTWSNEDVTRKFANDEYILVIETMLNFQYSVPEGSAGSSSSDSTSGGMTKAEAIAYINNLPVDALVQAARNSGNHSVEENYLKPYDYYTDAMQKFEDGVITQIYTMGWS